MSKLILTARDLRLLDLLTKYGVLSTSQMTKAIFGGIRSTTVLRRLRKLEHEKLITRVAGIPSDGAIWFATQKGAKCVGSVHHLGGVNRNTLMHDILISATRLRLEEAGIGSNWIAGYILKQLAGEAVREDGEYRREVIPDALFCTPIGGTEVSTLVSRSQRTNGIIT